MHQPAPRERTFFGMPIGLAYLSFTEAWERFSFYGMTSILVLYMSQALLLPGRVEGIIGFERFRIGLEALFGPMTTLALASQIFGLYAGFMYFTPVFGGLVADRWLGRRAAVMLGAILMSGGHIAMAFDATFLLALFLLIIGCGLLKGNISAQVGGLFDAKDGAARTRAFAIFSTAINIGAVLGPLVCGLLAQIWGWHVGFAASGLLMLCGLATYVAGFRYLPDTPRGKDRPRSEVLTRAERRTIGLLVLVLGLSVFQTVIYYQSSNIGLVWIDQYVDLRLGNFSVPPAWFVSVDSFASIVGMPLVLLLWRRQAERHGEPTEIGKLATGLVLAIIANLLQVFASRNAAPGTVSVIYPLVALIIHGVGFVFYWPPLLALVSRLAPPSVNATMMGVVFLSIFAGNSLIGWIGRYYEPLGPAGFWMLQVAIGGVGLVLILLLKRPIEQALASRVG
ncbi:MFS transporter [Polymorphobacter arshaanensis]|uniref:MFS transporter n=2 Tax=Glacieibacterium arshaanense TaxID=2511025 RepID=A0A4Y9ESW8_9SPHN|nr:MFS transporter [Polymorphobacter arshaanensis]